jgi:large subunit ribosomal protein L17
MKHRVAGRKLGRTSSHRLAVLRNLSSALFLRERITTTLMKAKELRPFAERLVTLSKRETLHGRRQVLRHIHDKDVVAKLFDTISARFAQRPGGYTRILKLGPRRGDNAEMAIVELVGFEPTFSKKKGATEAKGKAKAAKGEPASEKDADEKPRRKAAAKPSKDAGKKKDEGGRKATKEAKPKKKSAPRKPSAAQGRSKSAPAGRKSGKSE